jgi:CRP-like cAMP-binding protein
METSIAGATQPRLTGAALRNLAKATRPIVQAEPASVQTLSKDGGNFRRALRQGKSAPRKNVATEALTGAGTALARFGSNVGGAVGGLAADLETVGRSTLGHVNLWGRRKEDELKRLAVEAQYSILSNRFGSIPLLSGEERAMLDKLDHARRQMHQAGSDLVVEDEPVPQPMYIVSGWASRIRVLSNGRRQILGLLVPGDGVGLHGKAEELSNVTITAITTVETVDASAFVRMAHQPGQFPGIARALEREIVLEESFADNQIVRLGALSHGRRIVHLLLELQWRLNEVRLGNQREFPMPLTCETIADALGMRPVDVRRVMGALRVRKMFNVRYGRASVISREKAEVAGDFQPPSGRVRPAPPLARH